MTACDETSCSSTRPDKYAFVINNLRLVVKTSSDALAKGCGKTSMPSSASMAVAPAGVIRARLTRKKTFARCCKARITGSNCTSRLRRSRGASQSGQSRDARSVGRYGKSASDTGAGACWAPEKIGAVSCPRLRSRPNINPRPVSDPPSAAKDRLHRHASKTRSRIAARSPEPAKRCDRPQAVKAGSSDAPASARSKISMAADMRAEGVTLHYQRAATHRYHYVIEEHNHHMIR